MAVVDLPLKHDIDLVIVTGAGASREFGIQGKQMPLMADWSEVIVKELQKANLHYSSAAGLTLGMSGEEFEAQLGRFLRQVLAFPLIESLLDATTKFQTLNSFLYQSEEVLKEWHRTTNFHLGEIVECIHRCLYEQFYQADIDKALKAYSSLFEALRINQNMKLVYATTNYDTIGESVLERLGYLPDWGEPPHTFHASEPSLQVSNLLDGIPRYVPVLHLHGRIGWYRRNVENLVNAAPVYSVNTPKHEKSYGVPIVMLPDPKKAYDDDDIINSLWRQFRDALRRAKRVFVLGHSLNDGELVKAILQDVQPLERLALTVFPREPQQSQFDVGMGVIAGLDRNGAQVIQLQFGSTDQDKTIRYQEQVANWINRLEEDDPR